MKNIFYASFVPGMKELIAEILRQRLPDVSLVKLLDGAVIFETECTYDRLNFFCFNNIFAVIDIFDGNVQARPGTAAPLELHAKKILAAGKTEMACAVIPENSKKIKTFRIVCSLENKPASISENARCGIESFVMRNSALRPNRSGADTEFWFLYRREGFSVFMKRLTRSVEKRLPPGELPPQLAWLLCRVAGLKPGETALDPFCGYGSIAEAAVKHFPVKIFFALDIDDRCIKIARQKQSLKNTRCEIRHVDSFAAHDFLPEGAFDAIITDPPWGMYKETGIPLEKFYEDTLALFFRLLKGGGRSVILTAARRELELAAEKTPGLRVTQIIPVLVSGKKASVYVMEKRA